MQRSPYDTAAALLPLVGGPANITSVAHCMTRLRLGLSDPSLVAGEAVRAVPGVLGVVAAGDSLQVVLGPGVVVTVTAEFQRLLTPEEPPTTEQPATQGSEQAATRKAERLAAQGAEQSTTRKAERLTAQDAGQPTTREAGQPAAQGAGQPAAREAEQLATQDAGQPATREAEQPATQNAGQPAGRGAGQPTTREAEQLATQNAGQPTTREAGQPAAQDAGQPATRGAEQLAARGAELRAARVRRNATPLKTALRRIADVFVPLIPALIGCGVLAGLNGLLVNAGLLPSLTPALAAIASGFMALISVFVGYNTAKVFGGTPVLGGAVAAIVVYPGVAKVTAFGVALAPGQGGVLGALAAALLAVHVERWCRGRVPDALDVLLTPTVTVLVAGLATLYGLMYAAGRVSSAIGTAADWLLATTGPLAGLILGGLFLPLVMLGLHQALIPIHTTLIQQQGYTVLLPLLAMAGAGQVGAALAVYVRLRHDTSLRTTIKSALPAGLLGVGEPLIYGVSLPLGRPFLTACAGGAAGGAFVGFFAVLGDRVGATAIGPSGWALFPLLTGNRGPALAAAVYAGGLLTGYAVGFLATYVSFSADGSRAGDPRPARST